MNHLIVSVAALSALVTSFAALQADAQTAKDLVGTWTLVSSVILRDGTKTDTFGPNPSGMATFASDGHYAVIFPRRDLPKVASGDRTSATPDETQAIARGSIATFGTYTVEDKAIVLRIHTERRLTPTALAIARPVQWVTWPGGSEQVSARILARVSVGRGTLPGGRVLSRSRASTPASA